jgi:signal transduction protein with GAF and PtsI domain
VDRHDPKAEGKRLENALSRSLSELATLRARMEPLMPESDLKVFDGQRLILEDEEFVGRIHNNIANGDAAERAVLRVIEELSAAMRAVADDQLRAHVTDFREVGHSVLRHLRKEEKRGPIQYSLADWSRLEYFHTELSD